MTSPPPSARRQKWLKSRGFFIWLISTDSGTFILNQQRVTEWVFWIKSYEISKISCLIYIITGGGGGFDYDASVAGIRMIFVHRHLFHTWATLTNKTSFISKGGPCMKQVPVSLLYALVK